MALSRRVILAVVSAVTAAGCSSSSNTGPVDSGPTVITVSGKVVDTYGIAAPGETVVITSGTTFTKNAVSDATGAFSVAAVPTPYTATVLDSGGALAVQYQGLTRADPTLLGTLNVAALQSATLAGQLSGSNFPQTTDYSTTLLFASPQTSVSTGGLNAADDGTFSGTVSWAGPPSSTGTLYALQQHIVGDLPSDYAFGSLSGILLQNMGTLAGQNFAVSPVTTGSISGTVTVAAGYTLADKELLLIPAANFYFFALQDSSPAPSFTYATPTVPNATLTFLTEATDATGSLSLSKQTNISANASGLAPNIPAAPTLDLPVAAATGVTLTTQFSWSNFTGVYLWALQPKTSGTGPVYYIFTSATTATIPDLTSVGLAFPTSVAYDWLVAGIGPSTSIDATAIPGGLIGLELADGYFCETGLRNFTTAP